MGNWRGFWLSGRLFKSSFLVIIVLDVQLESVGLVAGQIVITHFTRLAEPQPEIKVQGGLVDTFRL